MKVSLESLYLKHFERVGISIIYAKLNKAERAAAGREAAKARDRTGGRPRTDPEWQLAHPSAPFVSSDAGVGLNDPLLEWPDRIPANVLDHHALGYRYDAEMPVPTLVSDILWYNSSTGETQVWYMDGHRLVDRGTVLGLDGNAVFIGPPFSIVGVGEFNPRVRV